MAPKKPERAEYKRIKRGALPRGLAASWAGVRAGGALAVDGALQKLLGRDDTAAGDNVSSAFARREAQRFVNELGRLKGTYVKIGQMLAMLGEHFLPPVLTEALHDLEGRTDPLPWSAVEPLLQDSLGERYHELEVDPHAIAAASLAQVHRARIIATGEEICLKLQYPDLAAVIDGDFDYVVRLLRLARWLPAGRDMDDWLESMRAHLHNEIDYEREARLSAEMARLVLDAGRTQVDYHVPRLYPGFCTSKVLAMEFVHGKNVSEPAITKLSQARRNELGRAMLELFFYELYDWGLLQSDPNFGNYLIRSERRDGVLRDELVLLDFGSILDCPEDFLQYLRQCIAAGMEGDEQAIVEALIGLGCLSRDASDEGRELFASFCLKLLEPLRPAEQLPADSLNAEGEYRWGHSRLMQRAGKAAAASTTSRHFTPPSRDFALIARKLTGVFTFIAVLEAEFNAYDMVASHIQHWREGKPGDR